MNRNFYDLANFNLNSPVTSIITQKNTILVSNLKKEILFFEIQDIDSLIKIKIQQHLKVNSMQVYGNWILACGQDGYIGIWSIREDLFEF